MKRLMIIPIIHFCLCFSASAQVTVREVLVDNKFLLKYSFSNSLNGIEEVVKKTTRIAPNLENAAWELDPNFPEAIKSVMNELNVNYATTPHMVPERMSIWGTLHTGTVYRRVGNQWFIYYYHKR